MEFRNIQLLCNKFPFSVAAAFVVLLVVTLIANCSDCPSNTTSCAACPTVATSCAEECSSITGSGIDMTRHCRMPDVVVACRPHQDYETANGICMVRVGDGEVFLVGAGIVGPAWRVCTAAEEEQLGADFCTDAGSDAAVDAD